MNYFTQLKLYVLRKIYSKYLVKMLRLQYEHEFSKPVLRIKYNIVLSVLKFLIEHEESKQK